MPGIQVRSAEEADSGRWDEFVRGCSASTPYHGWRWRDVYSNAVGLRTHFLLAERDAGVVGVLPMVEQSNPVHGRILTSLPFVNYGGPLARDSEAVAALVAAARERVHLRRAAYAEFRCPPGAQIELPCSRHKVRAALPLPDTADALWRSFPSKLRSQVKRAMKADLVADPSGGMAALPEFYELLARKWREHGSPLHARRLFSELLRGPDADVSIVLVRHEGTAVGAGWLQHSPTSSEMVWAATLRRYDRLSPNMLLYWTALQVAIGRGSRTFDFGRSTRDAGTHLFKLQWGSVTEDLPWYYVLGSRAEVPAAVTARKDSQAFQAMWSRLPLALTRLIGPRLARRLPL